MSKGIMIFGAAGAGKTTLGRAAACALGFPYFDIDDYIWRTDTEQPYTQMYPRAERASRLMAAISPHDHFVMAGSMDSFNAPFVPLFELAVHLTAPAALRAERLHTRELSEFGARILPGGDMHEAHERFLHDAMLYDSDAPSSTSFKTHSEWAASLPCPVLRLNGADSLERNCEEIVSAYRAAVGQV